MRILIAALAIGLVGCGGGGGSIDAQMSFDQAAKSGMVFTCSSATNPQEFAFSPDIEDMSIQYWSDEGQGLLGRWSTLDNSSYGTIGRTYADGYQVDYYRPNSAVIGSFLAYSGVLANFKHFPVVQGTTNVVGAFNTEIGDVDLFHCSAEEYSVADVNGMLLSEAVFAQ